MLFSPVVQAYTKQPPLHETLHHQLETFCCVHPVCPKTFTEPLIDFELFYETLSTFIAGAKQELLPLSRWLTKADAPLVNWFNLSLYKKNAADHFRPFIQKRLLKKNSAIALWGDLHGSIHSLFGTLHKLVKDKKLDENFKILDPNFYIAFLGDYVDRGMYGVEVLFILMKLKITNPGQVFLVRGNHEDFVVNNGNIFNAELDSKYAAIEKGRKEKLYALYDYLPVALYLGTAGPSLQANYVQCCHGGMELGFNPLQLLDAPENTYFQKINLLAREDEGRKLPLELQNALAKIIPSKDLKNIVPSSPTSPTHLGFMWNDFSLDTSSLVSHMPGRGWVCGRNLTGAILARASSNKSHVRFVIRAHQHHGKMLKLLKQDKGFTKLWDGLVYTLFSASGISYIHFPYNSFVTLTLKEDFTHWKLQHHVT